MRADGGASCVGLACSTCHPRTWSAKARKRRGKALGHASPEMTPKVRSASPRRSRPGGVVHTTPGNRLVCPAASPSPQGGRRNLVLNERFRPPRYRGCPGEPELEPRRHNRCRDGVRRDHRSGRPPDVAHAGRARGRSHPQRTERRHRLPRRHPRPVVDPALCAAVRPAQFSAHLFRHRFRRLPDDARVRQRRRVVHPSCGAWDGRLQHLHRQRSVDHHPRWQRRARPSYRHLRRFALRRFRLRTACAVADRHRGLAAVHRRQRHHRARLRAAPGSRQQRQRPGPRTRPQPAADVRQSPAAAADGGAVRSLRAVIAGPAARVGRSNRTEFGPLPQPVCRRSSSVPSCCNGRSACSPTGSAGSPPCAHAARSRCVARSCWRR